MLIVQCDSRGHVTCVLTNTYYTHSRFMVAVKEDIVSDCALITFGITEILTDVIATCGEYLFIFKALF